MLIYRKARKSIKMRWKIGEVHGLQDTRYRARQKRPDYKSMLLQIFFGVRPGLSTTIMNGRCITIPGHNSFCSSASSRVHTRNCTVCNSRKVVLVPTEEKFFTIHASSNGGNLDATLVYMERFEGKFLYAGTVDHIWDW